MTPNELAAYLVEVLDGDFDGETGARLNAYEVLGAEDRPAVIVEYDPDDAPTRTFRLTVEEIEL